MGTPALPPDRLARFAAASAELAAALDWGALGETYCSEGGAHFFGPQAQVAAWEAGLAFAADVVELLDGPEARAAPRSLYVGAALFELLPALAEVLLLEREVRLLTLPSPEVELLNRALTRAEVQSGTRLPRLLLGPLEQEAAAGFSHLWMVSVLSDPEAFPALHDQLYGRRAGDALATSRGDLDHERRQAARLCANFARCARPLALLSSTDEELPILRTAFEARSLDLVLPAQARLSAIVGDPVRHCRLIPRSSA